MSRIVERNETVIMEKIVNTEEKLCQKWMFRNLQYDIQVHLLRFATEVVFPFWSVCVHWTDLQKVKILYFQTQYCHGVSQLFLPPWWHVGWQKVYMHVSLICHPIRDFCHSIYIGRSQVQLLIPWSYYIQSNSCFLPPKQSSVLQYLRFATDTAQYFQYLFNHFFAVV